MIATKHLIADRNLTPIAPLKDTSKLPTHKHMSKPNIINAFTQTSQQLQFPFSALSQRPNQIITVPSSLSQENRHVNHAASTLALLSSTISTIHEAK